MITDAFIGFIRGICQTIFGLLPAWEIPVPSEQIQSLVYEVTKWDAFAPVTEVFSIASIFAAFFAALWGFKLLMKVIGWIRGSG